MEHPYVSGTVLGPGEAVTNKGRHSSWWQVEKNIWHKRNRKSTGIEA